MANMPVRVATSSTRRPTKATSGPTLTQVGSRLTAAWIYQWMKNPQSLRPGTAEPNRAMSDEDASALTAFLISQKGGAKQEVAKK